MVHRSKATSTHATAILEMGTTAMIDRAETAGANALG